MDWLDLLAVPGTLKHLLQHPSLKASILWHSAFFIVQQSHPLEKAMTPHSSTLAWKIPWMEEPGRLQSMGLRRVGHDWVTSLSLFTFMHWRRKWQPTPVVLPEESQGRGSLVGCHLWGCRVGHYWSDLAAAAAHPSMATGKTIALTRWTFVGKIKSLLFNMFFIKFFRTFSIFRLLSQILCEPHDISVMLGGIIWCIFRSFLMMKSPRPQNRDLSLKKSHKAGYQETVHHLLSCICCLLLKKILSLKTTLLLSQISVSKQENIYSNDYSYKYIPSLLKR